MAFDHKRLLEAKERTTIKRASVAPVGQWWTLTGSEAAAGITSTLLSLKTAQAYRLQQMVSNARLYGNLTLAGSLLRAPEGLFAKAREFEYAQARAR